MTNATEIEVNGVRRKIDADPEQMLLYILRDDLDLTGSKYGCGEGQCGACTVLINGVPTRSCITQVSDIAGKSITTIEGLAVNGKLHPVQAAFIEEDAFQCAYCTPGMIMSAVGLLKKNHAPSDEEIIHSMQGNVCRCGTFPRIVAAIKRAAKAPAGGGK